MFENLSIEALQSYWWIIISILGGALVFLMFVQGGQTLIYTIGKDETERKILVNSLGRKWEFTFTTLVTFGGAFFASFPLFYSTSFGGAYWVWMAILFPFTIQAVAYEFRSKPNNLLGHRTYEWFLIINGLLGTVLIGTAVGTFFTGSSFSVNRTSLTNLADPVISQWKNPAHGLEAVLNWRNVALGLAVFFLSRVLGLLYFLNTTDHEEIRARSKRHLLFNSVPFLVFFLAFVYGIMTIPGFAVDPANGRIYGEIHKYLHNLVQMPVVMLFFAGGAVFVILGIALALAGSPRSATSGFWYSGAGTFLAVFAIFCLAGFNNTAYYPSVYDLQSSLTIHNSSSSHYTLTAMSYVSLLVPFVLVYIWYAWKAINRKKIDVAEMNEGEHTY